MFCRYGKVGDVLWVRESFYLPVSELFKGNYFYKALVNQIWLFKWKPSIHMPKKAARLFLRIKDIRVERLWDISEEDSKKEGVLFSTIHGIVEYKNYMSKIGETFPVFAKLSFMSLWESINGNASLELNPWVWVIEFEKIEKPENFLS